MLRDTFQSATNGISLGNGNALDVWCWYCQFINNSRGMTNNVSGATAGNGSVFGSIFQNSTIADLDFGNTGIMTFSNNYSTGSNRFLNVGGFANPNNMLLQGNIVFGTTQSSVVNVSNWGPIVALDNKLAPSGTGTPIVTVSGTSAGNLFS